MQNPVFWCILGSENGELRTGVEPEGMARGEGWVGKGLMPKTSTSKVSKAPSQRRRRYLVTPLALTPNGGVPLGVSRHFGPRTLWTQDISALVPNCLPDILALHQGRHFGTGQHWIKPYGKADGYACIITWIRLIIVTVSTRRISVAVRNLCVLSIYAYLVITNRILNCVNSFVIRIINCLCQISS